jgi:hypothetical protein
MTRNRSPKSRASGQTRQPSRRSAFRPALEVLEGRAAPSAQPLPFTLDPALSTLTLSGNALGATLMPQGTGALTTQYSGTIMTSYDASAPTLKFVAFSTAANAAVNGNWEPLPGGGSGSAPADYGGRLTPFPFTVNIAVRNLVASTTTAAPLPLTGGPTTFSFPSSQTLTVTAGTADYNGGLLGSGTSALSGQSAANTAAAGTLQDLGGGTFRLTMPIDLTLNETVAGQPATLHITGTLAGTGSPQPVARRVAFGPDAGMQPLVRVFDPVTLHEVYNFPAFGPSFTGGVRVAVADVNGDGFADVIVASGPGTASQVRIFDGSSAGPVPAQLAGPLGSFRRTGTSAAACSSRPGTSTATARPTSSSPRTAAWRRC